MARGREEAESGKAVVYPKTAPQGQQRSGEWSGTYDCNQRMVDIAAEKKGKVLGRFGDRRRLSGRGRTDTGRWRHGWREGTAMFQARRTTLYRAPESNSSASESNGPRVDLRGSTVPSHQCKRRARAQSAHLDHVKLVCCAL